MLLLREYARRTQHNDRLISSYIYSVVIAGHYDIESLTARICPKVFAIQFQVIRPINHKFLYYLLLVRGLMGQRLRNYMDGEAVKDR